MPLFHKKRKIRKKNYNPKYRLYLKTAFFSLVFIIIFLTLPKKHYFRYKFEQHGFWEYKDLYASFGFFVRKNTEEKNEDYRAAIKDIIPFYKTDTLVQKEVIQNLEKKLEEYKLLGMNFNENIILDSITNLYKRGIIQGENEFKKPYDYLIYLIDKNEFETYNSSYFFNIDSLESKLQNNIIPNVKEYKLIDNIVKLIKANIVLDDKKNELAIKDALHGISDNKRWIKKGDLIVEENQVIDGKIFEELNSLKSNYEVSASGGSTLSTSIGQFLLILAIYIMFVIFIYLYRRPLFMDDRKLYIICTIITLVIITFSFFIKYKQEFINYLPYTLVPIIIRVLFDSRLALHTYTFCLLITAIYAPNSFEFFVYQLMAGIVAIYCTQTLQKRSQFLFISVFVFGSYLVIFLGFALTRGIAISNIPVADIQAFFFSSLMTLFALPVIYIFEKLFGIPSEFTLIELSNTNTRLLRELALKAPGTFHHSISVANLAEAGINQIKGNVLLVRAGALYHDIGKINNPKYFIENQANSNDNPHDKLPYDKSAKTIIQHVQDGINIATKKGLPNSIIDFIKTHHGTTKLEYFYSNFLTHKPTTSPINENTFKYPGPKPSTKETAVVMLADSVEASSRILKNFDYKTISDHVEKIFTQKIKEDQLSDSNLTLKDIGVLKMVFKSVLSDINHQRVEYPKKVN